MSTDIKKSSAFVEAVLVHVDELLQNSKRVGNFVEADVEDVKLLREQLEKREAEFEALSRETERTVEPQEIYKLAKSLPVKPWGIGSRWPDALEFARALLADRRTPEACPDIKGYVSGGGLDHVMEKVRAMGAERAEVVPNDIAGRLQSIAADLHGREPDTIDAIFEVIDVLNAAQPAPVVEPVPYTRSPFKNGSQWVTFNIRAEHADRAARALDGAPAACEACRENSANKHFLDALASAADGEGSEL